AAHGHEVPGGALGPAAQGVAAAQGQGVGGVGGDPAEAVVEHAVELGRLVDAGILGGRVVDQAAEVPGGQDRVDALPEQVAGGHLGAHVGGVDLGGQPLHGGRVVDQVVGVHLDADLDLGVGGAGLDVLPEGDADLVPLVVAGVEVDAVPGLDRPRRVAGAGVGAGQPGHGEAPLDPQQRGQLDRVANILGVQGPDRRVGVERVAVAVEGGQGHAGRAEQPQVLVTGVLAGPDGVDRQVDGGQEPARVDLGRVQAELAQGL